MGSNKGVVVSFTKKTYAKNHLALKKLLGERKRLTYTLLVIPLLGDCLGIPLLFNLISETFNNTIPLLINCFLFPAHANSKICNIKCTANFSLNCQFKLDFFYFDLFSLRAYMKTRLNINNILTLFKKLWKWCATGLRKTILKISNFKINDSTSIFLVGIAFI